MGLMGSIQRHHGSLQHEQKIGKKSNNTIKQGDDDDRNSGR
jgi:hypothetical protein